MQHAQYQLNFIDSIVDTTPEQYYDAKVKRELDRLKRLAARKRIERCILMLKRVGYAKQTQSTNWHN